MIRLLSALLFLVSPAALGEVQLLPGSSPQSALVGQALPQPVRIRVTEGGVPLEGVWVQLRAGFVGYPNRGIKSDLDECGPGDLQIVCHALTNADGVAQFIGITSDAAATISVVAEAFEGDRRIPGDATLQFSFSQGPGVPRAVSNDLWWGGPSENGWGLSTLTRFGPKLFNVLFVYDQAGAPTWFVQPQGSYLDGGPGLRYSAPIYSPRSAPWYAYSTASFAPGNPVGQLDVAFFASGVARLVAQIDGQTTTKHVARQDFSGESDTYRDLAGMWWGGPEQSGWGFAIHEQRGNLFIVWFTYDESGKPVWFVMPSSQAGQGGVYSGPIYRTRGSPWAGVTYEPSQLQIVSTGSYVLTQAAGGSLTFDYQFEGRSGRLELIRQSFD